MSLIKPTTDHLSDPYVLQLIEVLSKQQEEIERLTAELELAETAMGQCLSNCCEVYYRELTADDT
jgi:hypothetical protein